jgi:MFS transporter, FSR family, fosmidomycin resistance protein
MSRTAYKSLLVLSATHFMVDNYAGMLGAFLPFLQQKLNLTLSEAGLLAGVLIFSGSLMQPLYGILADRFHFRPLFALGPAVAGLAISSLGLAPNFTTLLFLLFVGGCGIAAFHPPGAAMVTSAAGSRPGYFMSLFVTSGTLGYASGPVYITSVIALAGLERSYWAALPGLLLSAYLVSRGPSPPPRQRGQERIGFRTQLGDHKKQLFILYLLVVIRSMIGTAFGAFLPIYFISMGFTEMRSSQLLTVFLLAGGLAGLLGGILADRLGSKLVLALSMIGSLPLFLLFLGSEGAVAIFFCISAGIVLFTAIPVNVVMAQKLAPRGASTVSALMMGFAWGTGGMLLPVVGALADRIGLHLALTILVTVTVPGFLLSLLLDSRSGSSRLLTRPAPLVEDKTLDHSR